MRYGFPYLLRSFDIGYLIGELIGVNQGFSGRIERHT